jgi:hypothetical protein
MLKVLLNNVAVVQMIRGVWRPMLLILCYTAHPVLTKSGLHIEK